MTKLSPARVAQVERGRGLHPLLLYSLIFSLLFVLHAPLLRLPYFWDEAGYYVPAARDLLLTGSLIPHSTASTAHPPLALAWVALWWKFSAYTPAVTRIAMLLISAFALLGVFRLARTAANLPVAVAATFLTAIYPVFFAQSSLLHVDMAAAALGLWGILFFVQERPAWATAFFCLAVLAKETAVIIPAALAGWELLWHLRRPRPRVSSMAPPPRPLPHILALLFAPLLVLAAWYGYHYSQTGYVFGNPEFFAYNVRDTLHPLRVLFALLKRVWHNLGYMNLFLLTGAAAMAMTLPPQGDDGEPRRRIAPWMQGAFAVVIAIHVVFFSLLGGAPLARYLLPALPLVVILCVSTIRRRVRQWSLVMALAGAGFVVGLFVNPPYPFAFEDNLAYRDYVILHKQAATLLARRYPQARVLTAWPATDELRHPYLGYTPRALPVVPIDDFSAPRLLAAARDNSLYDVALLFSTKYEPARNLAAALPELERIQERFFGYHRDLTPATGAGLLGGRIVYQVRRRGQWIAVIEIERAENARLRAPHR